RRLEWRLVAKHREQSDVAAVTPPHDPEALIVDMTQRFQVLNRAHYVVDFMAAVVDRVVVLFAEASATAILRTDDDVAALDRITHERKHVQPPVAVDATMHPDHCRVTFGAALDKRLEQVGGNIQ